ncbi:MAG TPA: amidohydrolase family protein [Gemmatimonadales bacterium]|nr:amidohydrolase family protein [Gemmatimonadales bacterium]
MTLGSLDSWTVGRLHRRKTPLVVTVLLLLAGCSKPNSRVLALEGATLIDGTGGEPKQDALIIIRNGRIDAVARVNQIPIPSNAERINLVGKTIIPGLVDAHAHVERWAVGRYLVWGVTTVRDLHSQTDSAIQLRNELNLGSILGPRMFVAGAMIDGVPPTYPGASGVATADQARRAVDQRAVAGVDYVKIYTKITPDLLSPLLDEAGKLRLPVAAHLGKTDALTAARAGVVSIEHMAGVVQAATGDPTYINAHNGFLEGWTAEEKGWAGLDSSAVARIARALADTKVTVVPTLVVHDMLSRLDNPILLSRPGMEDVPENAESVRSVPSLLRRTGWNANDFAAFRRSRRRQNQFVREFRQAGGAIAAGSDASNQLLIPGYSLHEEMTFLVQAGLSPLEAITAATRRGAQLLRADSLGMLAPGKVADLVVLNGNPTRNIAATRSIALVITRGRVIRPDSLRATWK